MKFLGAVIVCVGIAVLVSPVIYWMANPELTRMEWSLETVPVLIIGALVAGAGGAIVKHYEDMEDCE